MSVTSFSCISEFLALAPLAYWLMAYLLAAYLFVAYLLIAYLLVAYWLVAYWLVAFAWRGCLPAATYLETHCFGGSAPMATSHRVLLSPSTYIRLGVPLSLEVTRGRLPWLPPLFAFCPHLLITCFALNWHLPSIFDYCLSTS